MTTTVHSMKETIDALRKEGLNTKIFVGGAVLTEEYAKDIGADYYSKDAKSAVEIAKLEFQLKNREFSLFFCNEHTRRGSKYASLIYE